LICSDDYVSYMQAVAAAVPHLPFYLYDIDFITGIHCKSCMYKIANLLLVGYHSVLV